MTVEDQGLEAEEHAAGIPVITARHADFDASAALPAWRGSRGELVLRGIVLLLVLAAALAWCANLAATPRYVDDPYAVLREAAAGRLVELDPRGRYDDWGVDRDDRSPSWQGTFRWRTGDGTYVSPVPGWDVLAAVRAQPAVAAAPDSVTVARIREPGRSGWGTPVWLAALLGGCLLLVRGPQPRLLTRWGWFFTVSTGLGLVAYLVFGGSATRAEWRPPGRRANGWMVFAVSIALNIAALLAGRAVDLPPASRIVADVVHPEPEGGVVQVPPPPPTGTPLSAPRLTFKIVSPNVR